MISSDVIMEIKKTPQNIESFIRKKEKDLLLNGDGMGLSLLLNSNKTSDQINGKFKEAVGNELGTILE